MVRWHGWFDAEADALLCAAIEPLAAPKAAIDGFPDPRAATRRRADALLDLARIGLAAGTLPDSGGMRPAVTVTIDFESLRRRLGGGGQWVPDGPGTAIGAAGPGEGGICNTGEVLSPAAARRLACDARIIPVLLGSAGQPLDVGRATRTIPPAIRTALNVRDDGCAFPGCHAQRAWCDGHHIEHWADGGRTGLHNLVLLCSAHHKTVHHQGWAVSIDADGLASFHPPPWIDPARLPRRHHRYQLRRIPLEVLASGPPP